MKFLIAYRLVHNLFGDIEYLEHAKRIEKTLSSALPILKTVSGIVKRTAKEM